MVKEQKYITNESFPLCFFFLLLITKKIAIKKRINQFIEFDLNTVQKKEEEGTLSYN